MHLYNAVSWWQEHLIMTNLSRLSSKLHELPKYWPFSGIPQACGRWILRTKGQLCGKHFHVMTPSNAMWLSIFPRKNPQNNSTHIGHQDFGPMCQCVTILLHSMIFFHCWYSIRLDDKQSRSSFAAVLWKHAFAFEVDLLGLWNWHVNFHTHTKWWIELIPQKNCSW